MNKKIITGLLFLLAVVSNLSFANGGSMGAVQNDTMQKLDNNSNSNQNSDAKKPVLDVKK